MEDYDELSAGPDEEGKLCAMHNTWRQLPSDLLRFSDKLMHLNMSYNQITGVSSMIGSFILLEELNLSHNQISSIDSAIGKCIRLKHLNFAHNKMNTIPKEISKCFMLHDLLCSDNEIGAIPSELEMLPALHQLDVRRNNLHEIPCALSMIPTLKLVLCEGNVQLSNIQSTVQNYVELTLWCLRKHKEYESQLLLKSRQYYEAQQRLQKEEETKLRLIEKQTKLIAEVEHLKQDRPSKYLKLKKNVLQFALEVKGKIVIKTKR